MDKSAIDKNTIGNKTIQYSVYAKLLSKLQHIMDTTSVQLPDLERQSDTIKGAGIMGEVDMPTAFGFAAMTANIAGRVDSAQWAELGTPGRKELEVRWITDEYNRATGDNGMVQHRVVLGGHVKKRTPGKVETNATADVSMDLSVVYYKNQINGKTIEEIDILNSKYIVNGTDYAAGVRSFL